MHLSTVKWTQWDRQIRLTCRSCVHSTECNDSFQYCTSSPVISPCSPDNHHSSDGVYWRYGAGVSVHSIASVCLVQILTFESLDLETSFSVCRYNLGISMSSLYIKVIGSRSRSQEQKTVIWAQINTHMVVVFFWLKGKLVSHNYKHTRTLSKPDKT